MPTQLNVSVCWKSELKTKSCAFISGHVPATTDNVTVQSSNNCELLTTFKIIRNNLSVRWCVSLKPCLDHALSKLMSSRLDNQTKFVFLGGYNMVALTECVSHKTLYMEIIMGLLVITHKCKFPTLRYAV